MESETKELARVDLGGGAIAPSEVADILGDTTGSASSPLEQLSIYNQGKEDYWAFGEDKKKPSVTGIFLFSQRPMRAFWHPQKEMDGSPPSCWSMDSLKPHDASSKKEAESCGSCPWNQLGTAKQGKGRACKTKASDFLIEINEDAMETNSEKGITYVDPKNVLGPALLRYSIGNKEGPAEWQRFIKAAKEKGTVPQGVVARFGWQTARNKTNVKYSAIKIEVIARLPDPKDDPELWQMILRNVKDLKGGNAAQILTMLAGNTAQDSA